MFTQIDVIKQPCIIQACHVLMTSGVKMAALLEDLYMWSLRSFPVATTILLIMDLCLVQQTNMSLSLVREKINV